MNKPTDDEIYGRAALRKHQPWIVPESLEFLETILEASWRVFEWGSGGSTFYWLKKGCTAISVEHNSEWVARVSKMAMNAHLAPAILYVPRGPDETFRNYADAINAYGEFDLISVDGEASCRAWCLDNAIQHLAPNGWLLLDNSDWLKREMVGWERHDFVAKDLKWIGQKGTFNWHTSLLRRELG